MPNPRQCDDTSHGTSPQLADYDVEFSESAFYLCRRHTAEQIADRNGGVERVRLLDEALFDVSAPDGAGRE